MTTPAPMFKRFTERARRVIILARGEAERLHHPYLGTEHLLLGLLKDGGGIAITLLQKSGLSIDQIRLEVERHLPINVEPPSTSEIPFTPKSKRALEYSVEEARLLGHNYIGTEHLLLGLLKEKEAIAAKVLNSFEVYLVEAREKILNLLLGEKSKTPALDEFCRDFTDLAQAGKLAPVIGREREIERVVQILCRHTGNNPVLIAAPSVDKTVIVEGVAQRIVDRNVPALLYGKRVWAIDESALMAGTRDRQHFEACMKAIVIEIVAEGAIIFLEGLSTSGDVSTFLGTVDALTMLKPAVVRGEIQCIITTSMDAYRKHIHGERTLANLFQVVVVEPMSEEDTIKILLGQRERIEAYYRIKITEDAIIEAVKLSELFMPDLFQPNKSLSLIEDVCASLLTDRADPPERIHELQAQLAQIIRKKKALITSEEFERAVEQRGKEDDIRRELQQAFEEWRNIQDMEVLIADTDDIIKVLGQLTGLSMEAIRNHDTSSLPHYEWLQSESIMREQKEAIFMTYFDQRGQLVTYQYNAAGNINFGAVQNRIDFVGELGKLQREMARAREAGVFDEAVATDAEYQLTKAVQEARKPAPQKGTLLGHLSNAKTLVEGVQAAGGLVTALTKAVELASQFF